MSEFFLLFSSLLAGSTLGSVFFGSLYWMTKRIAQMRRPMATMLLSFFLRMGLAIFFFVLMIRIAPLQYAACFLGGFLLVKICFLWKQRKMKVNTGR